MNNSKRGFGFRPSDEELIEHLEKRTMTGRDYFVQEITDLEGNICRWEPSELPERTSILPSSDETWYFFYPLTHKYPECKKKKTNEASNGKRKLMINRATKKGKWKPSGNPRKVRAKDSDEEIGLKRGLYFFENQVNGEINKKRKAKPSQNSYQNKSNNKKSKAKHQNSYQNKTHWVLHQYELVDSENTIVLGKLMKKSKPTNKPRSNVETSQQLPTEVQLDFHEPLEETEVSNVSDWIQNQSSISAQDNETVTSFPVHNCPTYSEQEYFVNNVNRYEVSEPPSSIENYLPNDAPAQNLQVEYMGPITSPALPNTYIGAENQLNTNQYGNSFQNLVSFHNNGTYPVQSSNQQNVLAWDEGFYWPYDFNNHLIADTSQINDLDDLNGDGISFDEILRELETPNNFDGVQNLSNINQQHAYEFRNLNSIDNQMASHDERNKPGATATEGSDLPPWA